MIDLTMENSGLLAIALLRMRIEKKSKKVGCCLFSVFCSREKNQNHNHI